MRGIAGLVVSNDVPDLESDVQRLIKRVAMRPACGFGSWGSERCALAQLGRPLSDDGVGEGRPLPSGNGDFILVTDAELTNRFELGRRFALSTDELARTSDCGLVVRVYEERGPEGMDLLEGTFAVAVWHVRERRLFCATDHFSQRPLYFASRGPRFAFASTLRGLLGLDWISRELNDAVVADCLAGSRSPQGRTLYRDIQVLPAAHWLTYTPGAQPTTHRYWRAAADRPLRLKSEEDYQRAFDGEFELAVAGALRPSGGIGVMVSGGLDSAAVTAQAGRLLARQGRRLQAFHRLVPPGDPRKNPLRDADESQYVRLMERHLPEVDFHYLPPVPPDTPISLDGLEARFAIDWVPLKGFALDDSAQSQLSGADLSALAQMLWGLGGNCVVSIEAFPTPYFAELAKRLRWIRLVHELQGHRDFYGRSMRSVLRQRVFPAFAPRSIGRKARGRFLMEGYLQPDLARRVMDMEGSRPAPPRLDVRAMMAWTMNELMPQNVGASGSVVEPGEFAESYCPFFNRRLTEFCLSLPVEQQIREGRDRLLLRRAMRDLLPHEVAWRRTRGFPQAGGWARCQALRPLLAPALDIMGRSTLACAYLDIPRMRHDLLDDFDTTLRRVGAMRVRNLFNLGWFLQWLESAPVPD